eukprot:scaffold1013_cov162-Pinguiococcus_pyrenoidosus.AAC.1
MARRDLVWGLWEAALTGDVEEVNVLLDRGANTEVTFDEWWEETSKTPLHVAARNGHLEVVK